MAGSQARAADLGSGIPHVRPVWQQREPKGGSGHTQGSVGKWQHGDGPQNRSKKSERQHARQLRELDAALRAMLRSGRMPSGQEVLGAAAAVVGGGSKSQGPVQSGSMRQCCASGQPARLASSQFHRGSLPPAAHGSVHDAAAPAWPHLGGSSGTHDTPPDHVSLPGQPDEALVSDKPEALGSGKIRLAPGAQPNTFPAGLPGGHWPSHLSSGVVHVSTRNSVWCDKMRAIRSQAGALCATIAQLLAQQQFLLSWQEEVGRQVDGWVRSAQQQRASRAGTAAAAAGVTATPHHDEDPGAACAPAPVSSCGTIDLHQELPHSVPNEDTAASTPQAQPNGAHSTSGSPAPSVAQLQLEAPQTITAADLPESAAPEAQPEGQPPSADTAHQPVCGPGDSNPSAAPAAAAAAPSSSVYDSAQSPRASSKHRPSPAAAVTAHRASWGAVPGRALAMAGVHSPKALKTLKAPKH